MNVRRFQNLCGALNWVLKFMALVAVVSIFVKISSYLNGTFEVSRDSSLGFALIGSSSGSLAKFTNSQIGLAQITAESFGLFVAAILLFIGSNVLLDIWLEKTPFSEKQTRRLTIISFGIILLALIQEPLYSIILSFASPSANFFSFKIGEMFIFGLLMLCMTGMFKYGIALQKLSDDTV